MTSQLALFNVMCNDDHKGERSDNTEIQYVGVRGFVLSGSGTCLIEIVLKVRQLLL